MNKSPIEWCDYTWNPITGCLHGCEYCYARRFAKRGLGRYAHMGFKPTFHPDRLSEPAKVRKPSRIFTGSMGDILGDWKWVNAMDGNQCQGRYDYALHSNGYFSPAKVCESVADAMQAAPQHSYLVLTKADLSNPSVAANAKLLFDAGAWIGVSVTGKDDPETIEIEYSRLASLAGLFFKRKFVSIEPVMGVRFIKAILPIAMRRHNPPWIIIGGMTGSMRNQYHPDKYHEQIKTTVAMLQQGHAPVFVKDNMGYLTNVREYPEGMVGA